jgi:hypothetical protein
MRRAIPAVIAALVLAGGAQAKDLVLDLPAHVIVETFPAPGPNDKYRCIGASFAEFPQIRSAKSYQVVLKDVKYGQPMMDPVGPPFPDDKHSDYPAHWDAPPGFHRFALSGASTGQGCAQAILGLEGQWQIVSAKVTMTGRFVQRYKRNRPVCKGKVDGENVKLKFSLDRYMVVKARGGTVRVEDPDEPGRNGRVTTTTWADKGTIVTTGTKSAVEIFTYGGDRYLFGSGMKLRVNPGKSIEILERTKGIRPWPDPAQGEPRVRTDTCTLSARG